MSVQVVAVLRVGNFLEPTSFNIMYAKQTTARPAAHPSLQLMTKIGSDDTVGLM